MTSSLSQQIAIILQQRCNHFEQNTFWIHTLLIITTFIFKMMIKFMTASVWLNLSDTMRGFNLSICTWGTGFCPVPSWHHLLFGIRFYCYVLFIRYWFLESRCSNISHVISFHLVYMVYLFFLSTPYEREMTSTWIQFVT